MSSSEESCDQNLIIDTELNDASKEMSGSGVISGDVNNFTNEEIVQKDFDPDFVEERFRVDRRKLEELIRADENGICAEEFFSKIMKETDVYIAWPSKLKIGAKSKKDPYVKVSGKKGCVADAKNKILSNLTTKSLRVTLKMNVSHTEHSHVIGKGGNNIKKVMMETACHIHFPDSNRNNNNAAEKSSQVSVAGLFPAVEIARMKIRELLPLVIAFDVPVLCPGQLNVELLSLVESVQQKYGVSVSVKPHTVQSYLMSIHIRTSVFNSESAMKAADVVFEHLTGRSGVAYGVSLVMDLSAQHQAALSSGAGIHLNQIMQWTGTTIHIPDHFLPNHLTLTPAGSFHAMGKRKNAIYINGTMPNVFVARQHLLDCLPVVLMFDCDEDIVINPGEISKLSEELEVQVVVKLKPKHPSKSVIIKGVESNVEKLYEARRRILNLEEALETLNCDASKNFSTIGYLQQCPYKVNVDGMVVLPSNPTRPSALLASYTIPHNPIIRPIVVLPSSQAQGQPYVGSPFYYSASPPPHLLRHQIGGSVSVSPSSFSSYVSPTDVQSCHSAGDKKSSGTSPQLSPLKTASVSVKDHLFNKTNHFHADEITAGNVLLGEVHHRLITSSSSSSKINDEDDANSSLRITSCNGIFGNDLLHSSNHFQSSSTCHSPIQNNFIFSNAEFQKNPRNPEQRSEDFRVSSDYSGSSRYGPLTFSGENHKYIISETGFSREGDLESSSSSSHESSLNHSTSSMGSIGSNKAPGSNRPKKSVNSSNNRNNNDVIMPDITAELDYIKLKNLANQAMQKKPDGECRFPTDYWSGLGFSKSMPQSAIAEKLNQFNHLRYEGPSVPAQYEVANEDSEDAWNPGFSRLHQEELNNSKTIISLVNHLSGMSMARHEVFGSNDSPQWLDQEPLSDLDPLFNEIGLSKYINIFKQQEIDMATFLTLTDQDLKDLGINTLGARRKMLLVIEDLNRKQSVLPPPPGLPHPFRDPNFLKRQDIISHSIRW